MSSTKRNTLVFSTTAMAFGGAARSAYDSRRVWITTATGECVIVKRSTLPALQKWTSFLLGDVAKATLERKATRGY